jgi:hypothetical protein
MEAALDWDDFGSSRRKIVALFSGPCAALALVVGATGCHTSNPTSAVVRTPGTSIKAAIEPVALTAAPPIYAKGLTWKQGSNAIKIGSALSEVESEIVGRNGEPPLWSYSDILDDPKIAEATGIALSSNDNTQIRELGGERADMFLMRLRLLNAALSDLADAGVITAQIHPPWNSDEFHFQIWRKEDDICAVRPKGSW